MLIHIVQESQFQALDVRGCLFETIGQKLQMFNKVGTSLYVVLLVKILSFAACPEFL